jgi:hypothetical protein
MKWYAFIFIALVCLYVSVAVFLNFKSTEGSVVAKLFAGTVALVVISGLTYLLFAWMLPKVLE